VITTAISLIAAGGVPGISTFVTYGANTADSGATSVDPGATPNTKGAYSQLSASTSAVIQWLSIVPSTGGNTGPVSVRWYLDFATGAAASEVVLIPDMTFCCMIDPSAFIGIVRPVSFNAMTYIAASTRLAARSSSSSTDATDRLLDVEVITGTAPAEPSTGGASAYVFA
jgi:hypothetical protein